MNPSKSPRIVQVVLSLVPGGTERLVLELIRRLSSEIPMAACCLDEEGAWGAALKRDGIDVRTLCRTPGFHPMLGREISRIAAEHHANVIHCHQYSPFIYGCIARLWSPSLRIVFTEHGRLSDAPPSVKRKFANRLFTHMPREVYAVSHNLKSHIVAEGFSPEQVKVIYNGISVGLLPTVDDRCRVRRELGLPDSTFAVVTVARLDPVKDLDVLVRAIAALNRQRPCVLLIVGDGSERSRLEELAKTIEASDCIRFLGHRDDARELLAGCDAFANSSISEGISLTILEAMAAGLPVVATRVGGTSEILDDSCGRLVPARDPHAMTAALHEVASDPAVRAALARAGRLRVESRFTLERMIHEYRDAYFRTAAA